MELLTVIILLGINLMELIKFKFIVRIVVVELLLESVWTIILSMVALWSLLFAHQQSIYLYYREKMMEIKTSALGCRCLQSYLWPIFS